MVLIHTYGKENFKAAEILPEHVLFFILPYTLFFMFCSLFSIVERTKSILKCI